MDGPAAGSRAVALRGSPCERLRVTVTEWRVLRRKLIRPHRERADCNHVALGVALGATGECIVDRSLFSCGLEPKAGPALGADCNRIPAAGRIAQPARDVVAGVGNDRGIGGGVKE